MSYQAMAMDDNGFEIAQTQISIQVSILEETPSGLVSFVEEHTVTTDAFGMFSINIGEGNSDDDYASVDWSKSNFLKVELDEDMDGIYTLMGVSAFNSVPYSYMAENVMNPEDLMDNLGDHTATQTLDMDSNYVSQVLAPELPLDAANKQYVDDMIGDITTGAGEIIHYKLNNPFDLDQVSNCLYNDQDCRLITVVPNNKIIIVKSQAARFISSTNQTNSNFERLNISIFSSAYNQFYGVGNSDQKDYVGFPGDSISVDITDILEGDKIFGVYYQYTVSANQIDDNTTSYSMVSLDEGASSSGGAITEGTGGSSSQGGYMISEVSEEALVFAEAMSYCRNLEEGGYTDWYLPTIEDLLSAFGGKLINDIDPNESSNVWTTTPMTEYSVSAWRYLSFSLSSYGFDYTNNTYNSTRNSICIRKN